MTSPKSIIRFENVTKRFGEKIAVDNLSLSVAEGEFFALLGPSGCGKTTLLRMLAGFETPTDGKIYIDGHDVVGAPPNRRPVNMVFQSYAVFPHMTVSENVAYGLKMERVPAAARAERVREALALVKLETFADRKPETMSGGQRQRIALARALVKRPRVLLLDEPLSALDAKLRGAMRMERSMLQEKVGITFLMVTHDQDEALALASRCGVMNEGVLEQVAPPNALYETPKSRFVADFIGSVNIFEGRLSSEADGHAVVRSPDLSTPVYLDHPVGAAADAPVWVALRPEKIEVHRRGAEHGAPAMSDAPCAHNVAEGSIRHILYLGSVTVYEVELLSGRRVKTQRSNLARQDQDAFIVGEPVWLTWRAAAPAVLLS